MEREGKKKKTIDTNSQLHYSSKKKKEQILKNSPNISFFFYFRVGFWMTKNIIVFFLLIPHNHSKKVEEYQPYVGNPGHNPLCLFPALI